MNPYASPSECSQPTYDRTLLKRGIRFCLWFLLFLLAVDVGIAFLHLDELTHPQGAWWEHLYAFFIDWSTGV